MIQEELRIFIEQNCSGKEPSDLIMEAIGKKIEQLGADADEVLTFVEECTKGPTLEEKAEEAKRKAEAEAKANEELQEIIENLERALVDLKSGKDIAKSKATVERYARKAKMYFGNNPKVQKLLEEIEVETASAAKQAKSVVRNRTILDLLKRYGWILLVLIFVGIGLWYFMRPDPTSDPKACIDAAIEAVQKGNLKESEAICAGYTKGSSYSGKEIKDAYAAICKAYVEKGDYDRAISLIDDNIELNDLSRNVRKEISEKCLKAGNYDDADKYMDFAYHREQSEYYDFLCKCIDHMKENGKTNDIKSFIERKAEKMEMDPNHPELTKQWDPQIVKSKLNKYAGLDVND